MPPKRPQRRPTAGSAKKPASRAQPGTNRKSSGKTSSGTKGSTTVHQHFRRTRTGTTTVREHDRQINPWKQAGAAWASAGASGAVSLAMVAELGFTIVSSLAILLTALIAAAALMATEKATRKQRAMKRKINTNRGRTSRRR